MKLLLPLIVIAFGLSVSAAEPEPLRLGSGVNFGNMLEAPSEGEWGLKVEQEYFSLVKRAGFEHVRLPVSWTYHAAKQFPFAVDATFMARIEDLVKQALKADLKILVNYHHDHELNADPKSSHDRFLAIWKQIADRFQNFPNDKVAFELLNEPQAAFNDSPDLWNHLLAETLKVVRHTNPKRTIVVGPVHFNSIRGLPTLKLPDDKLLAVTVHYYDPFQFTHQGADWVKPVLPKGITWDANSVGLRNGLQNWSWDTQSSSSVEGLRIEYKKAWAGFQVHSERPRQRPVRIELKVNAAVQLKVGIGVKDDMSEVMIQTVPGKVVEVDCHKAGAKPEFDKLVFKCESTDPPSPFVIQEFRLVYGDRKESLLAKAADAIRNDMKEAAEWGRKNGKRIYLGEFGAFQEADMDSRVNWTSAARTTAQELQMDWCYWEFAAGFGIYDPAQHSYRQPLLEALHPKK